MEGGVKGYALGTFANYDNTAQAVGGLVGTGLSYITPGLGEVAFTRDVAGSAWHGLQAIGDMYNNGLNWRNGTTLGLSALGVGAGAFAALAPAKAAVESVAAGTEGIGSIQTAASNVLKTPLSLPSSSGYNPWMGSINGLVTKNDTVMYRVWGDGASKVGAWLSPVKPTSTLSSIRNLALPVENSAEFFSEVLVPAGTRYQIGKAASAFGQPGGGTQVLLLDRISPSNFGTTISLAPWL